MPGNFYYYFLLYSSVDGHLNPVADEIKADIRREYENQGDHDLVTEKWLRIRLYNPHYRDVLRTLKGAASFG